MAKLSLEEHRELTKGYDAYPPSYYYEVSNNEGDHYVGEVTDKRKTKSSILGFLKKITGGVVEPTDSAPDYQKRDFEKATGSKWRIKVEKADYSEEDCGNEEVGEHDEGYYDLGEEESGFTGWSGWGS